MLHDKSSQQVPLAEVARRLRLPFDRVLSLVRTHQLEATLVSNCRWFVPANELARYRRNRRAA